MLTRVIEWSIGNRLLVVLAAVLVAFAGFYALRATPLDALPDLSDVQVIVFTDYPGQAPQVVEDQVTYPITTQMLAVPSATVVRGYSFFGFSFVYVIFEDGTDLYWARSRVLEYLNYVGGRLPAGVTPTLGPDATGVGWAYLYALRSDDVDLGELRSLQDWFLKYELTAVQGVSEVASIGGFVKQYQITVDPNRLRAYDIPLSRIRTAVQRSNNDVGGRVLELSEAEFMVRGEGYIQGVDDVRRVALGVDESGTPISVQDVATVQMGAGHPPRAGGAERRGRGGRGHRRGALRRQRPRRGRTGEAAARGAALRPAGGRRDRPRLRPHGADRALDRHAAAEAAGRDGDRRARLRRLPAARAVGARHGADPAPGGAAGCHRDVPAGDQRQHHVARRHRDRDRRHGGRGDRDGRERAPAHRARPGAAAPLANHHARRHRGRSHAVLRAARHHDLVRADLHAGGAGGPAVQAARVHQDLCHGRGRPAVGDAPAGARRLLAAGRHPAGAGQSHHAAADDPVPPAAAGRARLALGGRRRDAGGAGRDRRAALAAGLRVHAAAVGRRPALHADDPARGVHHQGPRDPAADRPDPAHLPRGGARLRQGGAARRRQPIRRR